MERKPRGELDYKGSPGESADHADRAEFLVIRPVLVYRALLRKWPKLAQVGPKNQPAFTGYSHRSRLRETLSGALRESGDTQGQTTLFHDGNSRYVFVAFITLAPDVWSVCNATT